jgi:hypothetical protein
MAPGGMRALAEACRNSALSLMTTIPRRKGENPARPGPRSAAGGPSVIGDAGHGLVSLLSATKRRSGKITESGHTCT